MTNILVCKGTDNDIIETGKKKSWNSRFTRDTEIISDVNWGNLWTPCVKSLTTWLQKWLSISHICEDTAFSKPLDEKR